MMKIKTDYLFCSERLGFRCWTADDLLPMAAINADPEVMHFFPAVQSVAQTQLFIERMQGQYTAKGYCYFALERLDTGTFIGFTGLCDQGYAADFTPCTDTGWRLSRDAWGQGYATEAARRSLEFAFDTIGLDRVLSVAPAVNKASERIMQKAGMRRVKQFVHPLLMDNERLRDCVLYEALPADIL